MPAASRPPLRPPPPPAASASASASANADRTAPNSVRSGY
nr:hypothetical protein [Frigoribacterium sp. PvP032]